MNENTAEEYVFVVAREGSENKHDILALDDSVIAFESADNAVRYFQQLEDVPDDAGLLQISKSEVVEFARAHHLIVEVVESDDDYPTTIIRPQ